MATRQSIGVIVGTTRANRVGPQIVDFIADTIRAQRTSEKVDISIIDLHEWKLPFFDEPGVPSRIFDHNEYVHDHTKAWSREIQKHDAFIFVSPQYNWGYPAVLKNAIDYLFNEWTGKPAMVVTYGGHGGGQCGTQLKTVLKGIKMAVIEKPVELTFPSRDIMVKAVTGQSIGLDASSDSAPWSSERETIVTAYDELLAALSASKSKA
ncbi:hypothetical protein AMS68_003470 [Peltaster fructicola]|uniref:FMN reductase [NAD(P)H] n=1 Tax=Peltaster fructicola TaxID=286661 RepID=A0A6H0XTA3_9PEZI|nr:hypothetical protein AMS68_003470 [Peltaster fructicola]